MRRALATVQMLCFLVAGSAVIAPAPSRLFQDWSDGTIYPRSAMVYVVIGVVASAACVLSRPNTWTLAVPVALVVPAAQLAGLGFVAVRHWGASIGPGGGFVGNLDELAPLAWVVGTAGTLAAVSAIAQLMILRAFPVRTSMRGALLYGGVGCLILLLLPYGIAAGVPDLHDATSLGAFVLIYSAPLGITVAATAWLGQRLRTTSMGSCAAAAACSALDPMRDLTFGHGRPALVVTALVLALFALRLSRSTTRRAAAVSAEA